MPLTAANSTETMTTGVVMGQSLKGDRAMRARELVEQPEPSGESQMPEPGQEWKTILADLQRRATASHVNNSGQENSPQ